MIRGKHMKNSKHMKKASRDLIWMANVNVINLNVPFIDKFPCAGKIDLERWDFFITIACVWVALTGLNDLCIPEAKKEKIRNIVRKELIKKYPAGVAAINDCKEFMNRSLSGDENTQPGNALGCWIVWNLYGRKELDDDETQLIGALGHIAFKTFGSWWE